jgi:thymidylate kinase
VETTIRGFSLRNMSAIKKEVDFILLDRGFLSIVSSSLSRIETSKNHIYSGLSRELLQKYINKYSLTKIEDLSFYFVQNCLKVSQEREGNNYPTSYLKYQQHFKEMINEKSKEMSSIIRVDSNDCISNIHNTIISQLESYTFIKKGVFL